MLGVGDIITTVNNVLTNIIERAKLDIIFGPYASCF